MPEILDLSARHTRRAPVFVIGSARSGTSLLCSLLRRYQKMNFGTESQFLVRVYRRLHTYGDLTRTANLRRLVDDLAEERCFRRWTTRFGFVLDKGAVLREALAGRRSFAGVVDAIFSQFARYHRMPRWGDKTPEYNYDLLVLLSLFPHAQFIHIVRDGRDVALSTLRMGFGGANIYRVGTAWRKPLLLIRQFMEPLPPEQAITIHYETLLAYPADTMELLGRFLGLEEDPALPSGIASDIGSHVRTKNCNKWMEEMSIRQQRLFEAVAGDQLHAAGYPLVHAVDSPVGVATRLYWEGDHLLRKALKPQYWSDHLYRAGLRLRMARRRPAAAGAGREALSAEC